MFDRNSVCMTIIERSRALICRLTYYRHSIVPQICSPPSFRSRDAVSPLFHKHISFFVNELARHMLDGQGYKPHSVSVARDLLFYFFRRGIIFERQFAYLVDDDGAIFDDLGSAERDHARNIPRPISVLAVVVLPYGKASFAASSYRVDLVPLEPTLKAQLSFAWKPSRPLSRAAAELLRTLQSRIA